MANIHYSKKKRIPKKECLFNCHDEKEKTHSAFLLLKELENKRYQTNKKDYVFDKVTFQMQKRKKRKKMKKRLKSHLVKNTFFFF